MTVKRMILLCAIVLLCLPASALADNLDFGFAGNGGTWSWPGGVGSTLTATADFIQLSLNSTSPFYSLPSGSYLTFTTGGLVGGNGSLFSPFVWNTSGSPSTPSIFVNVASSTHINGVLVPAGNDFLGYFTNVEAAFNAAGGLNFVGNYVAGSVNSSILSALGLTGSTGVSGFMDAALNSNNTTGSGDMIITPTPATPVPEPTTGFLLLTGLGMIGLASLIGARVGKHSHTTNNEGEQSSETIV